MVMLNNNLMFFEMKRISLIGMSAALIFAAGCENAGYQVTENSVYLADAASTSKSTTVTMEGGVDIPILVRLAKKTDVDVTVSITFNPANLDEFNANNGTEYVSVPDDMLPSDASVTIPAGSVSASYDLHIDDFPSEGLTYAVPVQIGDVTGANIGASVSQGRYIYVLAKTLVVPVPYFKSQGSEGDAVVRAVPAENWGINVDAWTIEAWIMMDGYDINNQGIFKTGSADHEIYVRFGNTPAPYNFLQINAWGLKLLGPKNLDPKWYHWAFVYDGSMITIYRDGEVYASSQPSEPAGGQVRFDYFTMITSGSRYFKNNCYMSQVRLWNVARTQTEIQNNMYYEMNPKNPNLIGCWPMDEGEGSFFCDATGNGHDMTADEGVLQGWEPSVTFKK